MFTFAPSDAMFYAIPLVILIVLAALVLLDAYATRNHNYPEQ